MMVTDPDRLGIDRQQRGEVLILLLMDDGN